MEKTTRRGFLEWSGALAAGSLGSCAIGAQGKRVAPGRELRLLILGGTSFLGPHVVRRALERGHSMALFNRGRTNTHLFPELEKLKGDRNGELGALEGREWDAVIDTSGYFPLDVAASAGLLSGSVGQYVFVSSISVLGQRLGEEVLDEESAVDRIDAEAVAEAHATRRITGANYGALKALCEEEAERAFDGRASSVRPGLIVGPRDRTDRFSYWPVRVARGGEVLAPGAPEETVQFIDVRDVADFIVRVIEERSMGVYHADGEPVEMGRLLGVCQDVSGSDAEFTWADAEFLKAQGVRPWADMPVWVPPPAGQETRVPLSVERAVGAGLEFRGLADTVGATLDWFAENRSEDPELRTGISAEREALVLAAWRESRG